MKIEITITGNLTDYNKRYIEKHIRSEVKNLIWVVDCFNQSLESDHCKKINKSIHAKFKIS